MNEGIISSEQELGSQRYRMESIADSMRCNHQDDFEMRDFFNHNLARLVFMRIHPRIKAIENKRIFLDRAGDQTDYELNKGFAGPNPFNGGGQHTYIERNGELIIGSSVSRHNSGEADYEYFVHKDFYKMVPGAENEREDVLKEAKLINLLTEESGEKHDK